MRFIVTRRARIVEELAIGPESAVLQKEKAKAKTIQARGNGRAKVSGKAKGVGRAPHWQGKGSGFQGQCFKCQKTGHRAADCPNHVDTNAVEIFPGDSEEEVGLQSVWVIGHVSKKGEGNIESSEAGAGNDIKTAAPMCAQSCNSARRHRKRGMTAKLCTQHSSTDQCHQECGGEWRDEV